MIRFGPFELDPDRRQLLRGGREVRVEPKVLGVISHLVANRERMVTKEELLEEVWEGKHVSESALTRVIRDARKALGDSPTKPAWIRTVYGKGFLFIGDAVAERARPSIAVLPFSDLSADRDQAFFCEGLADEIINVLTRLERLDVISRKSSFDAAKLGGDARAIGTHLGVTKILEGSVRKAGERMRVTVSLVDVASGKNLWSEKYGRAAHDVFAVQEDIAEHVARALLGVLGEGEQRVLHQHPNVALEAWELYLRGRQLAYQESRRCLESAREMFVRAIELEPEFALAWSGIADALADLYLFHVREESFRRGAEEAAARAVELDATLAAAHVSRAQAHVLRGEHDQAITEFETAIALDARSFDAHHLFARFLWTTGRAEAAVLHLERASAIRPDAFEAPMSLTQLYFALGRESDRHNAALRTNELTRKRLAVRPDDVRALCMSAEALYVLGEREAAMQQIDRAYAIDPHDVCTLYNSACVFALDGQFDRGAEAIEGAVAGGFTYREWLSNDPDLALLREHPRFRNMIGALPALGGE